MHSQQEITDLTNKIVDNLGECDLGVAMSVLCNLLGQILAEVSGGRPSVVQTEGDNIAENVKKAAIAKLMYQYERKTNESTSRGGEG